jgi:hypothetical protein
MPLMPARARETTAAAAGSKQLRIIDGIEGWASALMFGILESIRESLCPYFHYL